jgi:outer membrane protein OmpA-like peptidoglycan-associated protein
MSAHGVTIEVISQQGSYTAPQEYVQQSYAPQPATYTTMEQAPPAYAVATVAAPMAVETAPIMAEEVMYADDTGFEAPPAYIPNDSMMMAEPIEMAAFEPAPMMMEDVGAPMNIVPMPMQATMIEEPAMQFVATTPMMDSVRMDMPAPQEMSVDLGAVPVFNTEPIETMPMVEMAALPMTQDGAVEALMQATLNQSSDFSVFFGFDSDEVTLEAEDVLIDTVEQIRLSGATRVGLMGFTDSVGDARYNQLLAMRRAQSVRKYLQDALGASVTFEIMPVGEVQAVQNGGDGVKEALNRKVEVSIQ